MTKGVVLFVNYTGEPPLEQLIHQCDIRGQRVDQEANTTGTQRHLERRNSRFRRCAATGRHIVAALVSKRGISA